MEIFVTAIVVGVLLRSIELFRSPPPWLRRAAGGVARRLPDAAPARAASQRDEGAVVDMTVQWSLFSRPFIAHRLAALDRELERLDRDPDVFAKAFHTIAARSAYEALAADARRLAESSVHGEAGGLEFELLGPSSGRREEIEI